MSSYPEISQEERASDLKSSESEIHESIMSSPEIPLVDLNQIPNRALRVDFQWSHWKSLITELGNPDAKPLYILDYRAFKKACLVFQHAADKSTFATGTLHPVSINADCEIRGHSITLKALKRLKTEYMHLSHVFSKNDTPVPMRWVSQSNFKTWDFICLDEVENPVAKFSAGLWALKKVGVIEFLGEGTASDAAREELMITGLTLFYCMVLRMNNPLNLVGSILASPGKGDKDR